MNKIRRANQILQQEGFRTMVRKTKEYTYRNIYKYYYNHIYSRKISSQKEAIHDLLNEDEFVLIILDACRHDYLKNVFTDFFSGELSKKWSEASRTPHWVPNTWTKDYDITYISGSPWVSSDSRYKSEPTGGTTWDTSYRPTEHFETIVPVIATDWSSDLYTTKPRAITDSVLRHLSSEENTRIVVHYMQPHKPYIADKSGNYTSEPVIPVHKKSNEPGKEARDKVGKADVPRYRIRDQIKDGNLNIEELRNAYRNNLRAILGEVNTLIEHIDPESKTVVTADHGEFLGERIYGSRKFMHPDQMHPILREVPWLEISNEDLKGREVNMTEIREESKKEEISEDVAEDRLKALGYL